MSTEAYPWPVNFNPLAGYVVEPHPLPGSNMIVCVTHLTYGRARINIGPDRTFIDDNW